MIAAYIRVSTLRQKEEGASIETQMDRIAEHALRFEIVKKNNKSNIILMMDIRQNH